MRAVEAVGPRPKRARQAGGQADSGGGRPSRAAAPRQCTDEQWAALREAEQLRSAGRPVEARVRLASEKLMHGLKNADLAAGEQTGIDVRRWYAAYTGDTWDGTAEALKAARDGATQRAKNTRNRTTNRSREAETAVKRARLGQARRSDVLVGLPADEAR